MTTLRVLHTSDWHLGHVLHDVDRAADHAHVLQWLVTQLVEQQVDVLLVAGDVFDTSNPSAEAQRAFFEFLARARQASPSLQVVLIAGNHDSAARLDAPDPLLRSLGVHVVGALPPLSAPGWEDRLVVPLRGRDGAVAAWVAAVPFLRPNDLPVVPEDAGDPLIEGVRRVYQTVLEHARSRRQAGQALLAMGHLYLLGTQLSEWSERKILGGNQHALPLDVFPEDLAYVALGHLHLAQQVGRPSVRYCGSPLPMALAESDYPHQVCIVDFEGDTLAEVRTLPVPRLTPLLRIPARGAAPLDEVLAAIAALPNHAEDGSANGPRTLLEVTIALEEPEPGLRARLEHAMEKKSPRLVKVGVEWTGHGAALAEAANAVDLRELTPEDVFVRRYQRAHDGAPAPELLAAFHELLDLVAQDEAGG